MSEKSKRNPRGADRPRMTGSEPLTAWLLVIGTVLMIALVDFSADKIVDVLEEAFVQLF